MHPLRGKANVPKLQANFSRIYTDGHAAPRVGPPHISRCQTIVDTVI